MKLKIQQLCVLVCLMNSGLVIASPAMPDNHSAMPGKSAQRIYGKVVESMDTGNYTYVQIDTGSKKYWAAGPKTSLKKGSMIAIDGGMEFKNFESKAFERKFDSIYFVGAFILDKKDQAATIADPHAGIKMPAKEVTLKGIKKVKDGKTVAEVIKQKKTLSGKSVKIRGKVVKYTAKVLGKNWLTIQDSSGPTKLVVTTDQEAKIGDLVVVNGVVAVDQDLGYGYTYDVVIERAIVSVE